MKKSSFILIFLSCLFLGPCYSQDRKLSRFWEKKQTGSSGDYQAQDFSYLLGTTGFDNELLRMHFTLYQGYVKNTNDLIYQLKLLEEEGKSYTLLFGALKRRYGWEFNGMRLHELYFENLGGKQALSKQTALYQDIVSQYGSFQNWKDDFIATGMMRGIGWVIFNRDPFDGRLSNNWISEHDIGGMATADMLLVMDVWEHAYLPQFGLDRKKYIQAFFKSIDWDIVNRRFVQFRSSGID